MPSLHKALCYPSRLLTDLLFSCYPSVDRGFLHYHVFTLTVRIMNKAELAEKIAQKVGLTKKQVEDVLETFQEITMETLKAGGEVTLTGFGTFSSRHRAARMGVNPQNPKERMQIPAVLIPKFKAGKTLKDTLKGK